MTVHAHDVATGFDAALAEECGEGLEQALSNEVTVGDECFEFFDEFVVEF
jgi:hypothetical protein